MHTWVNSRKDGFVHSGYIIIYPKYCSYCFINNFEPNPMLVIVNKLKPYKYVDHTLKGIQSSKNQNPTKSIDPD